MSCGVVMTLLVISQHGRDSCLHVQLNMEKVERALSPTRAEDGGLQNCGSGALGIAWQSPVGQCLRNECPSNAFHKVMVFQSWDDHKKPGWEMEPRELSYLHAVQGSEKLFKGKDFSCTGSFGLFSGEIQETTCQNRSLSLKLPGLDSMGSQRGWRRRKGKTQGRSAVHSQSLGNMQKEGKGIRAHGERIRE